MCGRSRSCRRGDGSNVIAVTGRWGQIQSHRHAAAHPLRVAQVLNPTRGHAAYVSGVGHTPSGTVRPGRVRHRRPLGPFPWGGDANTINQAAVSFLDPAANSPFVASMRMAVDVGNWEANRFVLPGGQSGNPMSPHYDDQLERYRTGRAITIAWSNYAIDAGTRATLELRPE